MATSNDITWKLNRDEIIAAAYRKLGIPGEGNILSAAQIEAGAEALNGIIALAVTDGMSLWKRTTVENTPSATNQLYTVAGAVKIAEVSLRDTTSGTRYDLEPKSLYDFNSLSVADSGVPVAYSAQPTNTGYTIQVWPYTSDADSVANKKIDIIYQRKFDGFVNSMDDLDMPSYWHTPIIYKLASVISPESGVPLEDRKDLRVEAKLFWDKAADYGDEDGSVFFAPNSRGV